ncbi:unnamed protein product [Schistosoma mattheei]|uniref:Uncharacterized protein n=1 Tax=Schistosoma mattheei TaxID=31246 RepID=A0A183PVW1_9TREM|nr:unnamed protein product [Schistosoma mattheei]
MFRASAFFTPNIEAAHTELPVDVNPPTTEEIGMAIRQIKRGKAARPDNIPVGARNNYKHASLSIQEDSGGGTSADGPERRTPHLDFKERSEKI